MLNVKKPNVDSIMQYLHALSKHKCSKSLFDRNVSDEIEETFKTMRNKLFRGLHYCLAELSLKSIDVEKKTNTGKYFLGIHRVTLF